MGELFILLRRLSVKKLPQLALTLLTLLLIGCSTSGSFINSTLSSQDRDLIFGATVRVSRSCALLSESTYKEIIRDLREAIISNDDISKADKDNLITELLSIKWENGKVLYIALTSNKAINLSNNDCSIKLIAYPEIINKIYSYNIKKTVSYKSSYRSSWIAVLKEPFTIDKYKESDILFTYDNGSTDTYSISPVNNK
jgi:hypothetical protein